MHGSSSEGHGPRYVGRAAAARRELVRGETARPSAARATQGRLAGTHGLAGGPGRVAGWVWRARGAGPGPGMMVGAIPLCSQAGTEAGLHLVHTHAHTSETAAQLHGVEQLDGHQCMCGPGSWLAGSVEHTEGKGSTHLCPALAGTTSKGPRHCSHPQAHARCTQAARGTQAPLGCQAGGK